jgi:hypothetical protein
MNDAKNLDKSKNSSTLNVEFDLVMPRPPILHRDECQIVPCRYTRQCKALDSISLCGVHFVSIASDAHYLLCIFHAICFPALPISSHSMSSLYRTADGVFRMPFVSRLWNMRQAVQKGYEALYTLQVRDSRISVSVRASVRIQRDG